MLTRISARLGSSVTAGEEHKTCCAPSCPASGPVNLPRVLAVLRGDEPLRPGSMPGHDPVGVRDTAAHDQDLRGALDLPGGRESAGVTRGLPRSPCRG